MNILLWDIDGTLLWTGRAGLYALLQTAEEQFGIQPDVSRITFAGMTDYHIASEMIFEITGVRPDKKEIKAFLRRYEQLLPSHLLERQGYSITPVRDILSHLHDRPEYVSLLLTGNSTAGARAKLSRYSLDHFFDFTASAFGDDHPDRSSVAAQAMAHIKKKYPQVPLNKIFVIGDTPNDIRCGKQIGARTIAVATGPYTAAQLSAHSPWLSVQQLPTAEEFVTTLALS